MKIGILTYHYTANYGAVLQTVSLYRYLKCLGHDVEIIDYRPLKSIYAYSKSLFYNRNFFYGLDRYKNFSKFIKKELKISTYKSYKSINIEKLDYDLVIVGSDEVWNVDGIRGFDTNYFLEFCENELKVSFSPSFGEADISDKKEIITKLLSTFYKISVRDHNSSEILNQLKIDHVLTLDPTFLLEYDRYIGSNKYGNYILLYVDSLSPSEIIDIKKLSDIESLNIVSINNLKNIDSIKTVNVDPGEWINLMHHSKFVVTNFYHGVLFSLILNKRFKYLFNEAKRNKVDSIFSLIDVSLDTNFNKINLSKKIEFQKIKEQTIEYLNFEYHK